MTGNKSAFWEEVLMQRAQVFNGRTHPAGHNSTNYERWVNATEPYEIEYELGYEPWGVMHR